MKTKILCSLATGKWPLAVSQNFDPSMPDHITWLRATKFCMITYIGKEISWAQLSHLSKVLRWDQR